LSRSNTAAVSAAKAISRAGSNNSSKPGQMSEMIGTPQAAASNSLNAGTIAGGDHVGAGDVQREPAGAVEGRVVGRRHMLQPLDIARPGDVGRILRTCDAELQVRRLTRGV
jgi:hypothetical protein